MKTLVGRIVNRTNMSVASLAAVTFFCLMNAGCNGVRTGAARGSLPSLRPLPPSFTPLVPVGTPDALKPSPYTFDVTSSGEATWELPLWIPAGRNDIAPRISITYGSKRGSGVLGKGFAVSGLSTIARCWQTPASDGKYTQFGDASHGIPVGVPDALCLDGERLVPRNGGAIGLQPENDPSVLVLVTKREHCHTKFCSTFSIRTEKSGGMVAATMDQFRRPNQRSAAHR